MKIGSLTKPSIFLQLCSDHQGPSLQQRRLRKTQAELASNTQLWTIVDDIEKFDGEENQSRHDRTEISQGLPLSPLMDSKLISARERHTRPKQRGNPSNVQKKLLMNPYGTTCALSILVFFTYLTLYTAQALASPLRYCSLIGIRLPKEFFLSFGIVNHPETGRPWHCPKLDGLMLSSQKRPLETPIVNVSPGPHSISTEQKSPPPPPAQAPTQAFASGKSIPELATGIAPLQPSSDPHGKAYSPPPPEIFSLSKCQSGHYYLSSHSAMKFLSMAKKEVVFRTLPVRWRSGNEMKIVKSIWRKDMHKFVQILLCKHAFATLKSSATNYKSLVVKDHPDVPLELMSAALWLGKSVTPVLEDATPHNCKVALDENKNGRRLENGHLSSLANNKKSAGPPPYAMMSQPAGCYMPVYNLPVLMGAERVQELRTVAPVFDGEMIYLRQQEKTVKAQMALWKLMGYMSSVGGGEIEGKRGGGKREEEAGGRIMWRERKEDADRQKMMEEIESEHGKEEDKNEERKVVDKKEKVKRREAKGLEKRAQT